MRRAVVGLVLMSVVTVALVACSDDMSSDTSSNSTTNTTTPVAPPAAMRVTSPEFADGGTIPTEFTCAGAGSSPELRWSAPPPGTQQLALLVFDPDAGTDGFVHFLVWGIAPAVRATQRDRYPGGIPGMNGRGSEGWVPPCPPPGGPHHYRFTLYALDHEPQIAPTANVHQFLDGIRGSVIGEGHLTGLFGR